MKISKILRGIKKEVSFYMTREHFAKYNEDDHQSIDELFYCPKNNEYYKIFSNIDNDIIQHFDTFDMSQILNKYLNIDNKIQNPEFNNPEIRENFLEVLTNKIKPLCMQLVDILDSEHSKIEFKFEPYMNKNENALSLRFYIYKDGECTPVKLNENIWDRITEFPIISDYISDCIHICDMC